MHSWAVLQDTLLLRLYVSLGDHLFAIRTWPESHEWTRKQCGAWTPCSALRTFATAQHWKRCIHRLNTSSSLSLNVADFRGFHSRRHVTHWAANEEAGEKTCHISCTHAADIFTQNISLQHQKQLLMQKLRTVKRSRQAVRCHVLSKVSCGLH